jgi:hypothetical protein
VFSFVVSKHDVKLLRGMDSMPDEHNGAAPKIIM